MCWKATVRACIVASNRSAPEKFRIVEFSVQLDHVHLIVEAEDTTALPAGMHGLSIRLARAVNQLLSRRGRFIADRWHGRELTSPRAVRHALLYVLANFRKHGVGSARSIDPLSSAPYFLGFREFQCAAPCASDSETAHAFTPRDVPVLRARTWLLTTGWLRRGRLSVFECPAG